MEARTLGPCLPTNKRPSTAAANESEFYPSYLPSTSTLQQPRPAEQIAGRAPKKQASEPPAENTLGERKTKDGWDKHKRGLQAHTKKQALPRDKQPTMFQPNTRPAALETHHKVPHCNRNPTTPNQKRKPPAINDPTAGSPTVTLLRLLLPLNDKVQ